MKILLLAAQLLLLVGCSSVDMVQVDAPNFSTVLWQQYSRLFPKQLPFIFRSKLSLEEAHRQAGLQEEAVNASSTDNVNRADRVGCTTYSNGAFLAERFRDTGLQPLLVDELTDSMCFTTMGMPSPQLARSMLSMLDFATLVSSGLRVHPSLYEVAQSSDEELLTFMQQAQQSEVHMSVHFAPTLLPLPTPDELLQDLIMQQQAEEGTAAMTTIPNPHPPFDDFFWSSPVTQAFYRTDADLSDPGVEQDAERSTQWSKLGVHFNTVQPQCNFSGMVEVAQERLHEIRLPLTPLFASSSSDLEDIRACVAYLTAFFAVKDPVHFLALQRGPQILNYRARSITQSAKSGNTAFTTPYTAAGLLGDNQIGSVGDTGVDSTSCYFSDTQGQVKASSIYKPYTDTSYRKVIQYSFVPGYADDSDVYDGHGTHVAGTMLGSINKLDPLSSAGEYDGMAPNAKLAFVDMATTGNGLADPGPEGILSPGYSAGSRVHSNSWGSTYSSPTNTYYYGADVDLYLHERSDLVLFYSAGNEGGGDSPTITMDASSKNVIAVGSSHSSGGDPDYIAWYSSIGPAYDGRFKPDLIAPGDSLMSAKSNGEGGDTCATLYKTGTSMAAPCAAGNALLVRQYFQDTDKQFWLAVCSSKYANCASGFTPSGVLLKTVLLHSGGPMALYNGGGSEDVVLGAPPDSYQGWGRVTLSNVLPLQGVYTKFDLFVADQTVLKEYSSTFYNVIITKKRKGFLKATLSWYDPPSVPGTTTQALLQNIDMTITSPSGVKYYGNGGESSDTINNNEQIFVDKAEQGAWKVKVNTKALPVSGKQAFSIVITSNGYVQQLSDE